MNIIEASPESISKSIFEKYYQIIESQRIEFSHDAYVAKCYDSLERLVMAIERSLQDISSNEALSKQDTTKINNTVSEFLNNWLPVVICADEDEDYLRALIYNLFVALHILENLKAGEIVTFVRHLCKIEPDLELLSSKILTQSRMREIFAALQGSKSSELNFETIQRVLLTAHKNNMYFRTINDIVKNILEDKNIKEYLKGVILFRFAHDLKNRYHLNYFQIDHFDIIIDGGVSEVRDSAKTLDLHEHIERMFEFNDENENLIWSINVMVENKVFNAAEIGYLVWSISKSLESIDDIEVELTEWGDGSKWFNLKVRIKSLASKVDLLEVMKNLRQGLEAYYFDKPSGEIKKSEAEAKKIDAEAEKIEKETSALVTPDEASIIRMIEMQEKLISIQEKEIDIEFKKADVRLKNLQYLKGLSELLKSGIIENDSDIQIMINRILFFEKRGGSVKLGPVELLDVKEQKEDKDDSES